MLVITIGFSISRTSIGLTAISLGLLGSGLALPRGAFIHLYWKVIGWYVLASFALGIYFAVCAGVASLVTGGFDQAGGADMLSKNIPLLIMTVIGYLALVLSLNVVIRVYLLRDLWVTVLQHAQVHDIGAAANVAARGDLATALGEGFADGLDVAGF